MTDYQKKLEELDELRQELIARAREDGIKRLEDAQPNIPVGSKGHEALLESAYHMTKAEAEKIIKERDEDPVRWPLSEYRKAEAFLAALKGKPITTSPRKPWRTRSHSRTIRG